MAARCRWSEAGRRGRALLLLWAALSAAPAAADTDWLTFAGDTSRTGYNGTESVLSPAAVPGLKQHWATDLGGPIVTQPTLLRSVGTASGTRDLVFAASLPGTVFALDAQTGTVIWRTQLGVTHIDQCGDFNASGGQAGVVGTPTLDPENGRLLVVDGQGELHALGLGGGAEQPGFPLEIIDPDNQAPRTLVYGSPTLAGQTLYVATASGCDTPPAHAEVIAVALDPPQVAARWFVDAPDTSGGGGIWGPGGVSVEPDGSAVYAATGNSFDGRPDSDYGEHIVALSPGLQVLAADAPGFRGYDRDFGATPLLFQPPGCPPLLAAMNKSGRLFLYDRSQIGRGARLRLHVAPSSSNGNFIGIPAYDPVTNALYLGVPANHPPYFHGLLALSAANCRLLPLWNQRLGLNEVKKFDNPVIPPTVADGVVWYADGAAGVLSAFNAADGSLLWQSGTTIGGGIFAPPTVVNGQVFVAAYDHKLYAFGL